jgi:AraC family transcriptional regulator
MTSELSLEPGALIQLADYPSRATFGPRRLIAHEFIWILRGSALWTVRQVDFDDSFVRERRHRLTPGTIGLGRAGTVDSFQCDQHSASAHAYVQFRIIDSGHLRDETTRWPAVRSFQSMPILGAICAELVELSRHQSRPAQSRTDELIRLLLDLFVTGPLPEAEQSIPAPLLAVAEHVRNAWAADGLRTLDVSELARAADVSPRQLFGLFREGSGYGPARVFELVRLARAAVLLQRSNATISEVARLSGFADPNRFGRRFAAVYGAPPSSFRSLKFSPDPLEPVRAAGLLSLSRTLLNQAGPQFRATSTR